MYLYERFFLILRDREILIKNKTNHFLILILPGIVACSEKEEAPVTPQLSDVHYVVAGEVRM